ncbi:glycoside hydrolase family 15 protein [Streptomyces sp. NPDC048523]|uniref:glycoside hydrolase family 15 protein n=1 Tax=Streptomyces sp. NPDC048523 TaxID=3365567 RepID=UPI003713D53C
MPWHDTVPALASTAAPRDARRAYAVLRGLTTHGGGMVAAATTSLPERAKEGRNYDYRYVWIRDQSYAGQAAAAVGAHDLLDASVDFVTARLHADGPRLAPAYTVHGKVGNQVCGQFQLDCFGEALLLLAAAERHGCLDEGHWKAVEIAVRSIADRWREPDAGIWELRGRLWTHSRLICVAGLRAVAAAALRRSPPAIHSRTPAPPWPTRSSTPSSGPASTPTVTGSARPTTRPWTPPCRCPAYGVPCPPPTRAPGPPSPHAVGNWRTTTSSTASATTSAPLEEAEGAFVLCGFVMALAEHQQGRTVEAYRWFERDRGVPAGLGAVRRGVRHRPASAARQPPACLRARGDAGGGRPAR